MICGRKILDLFLHLVKEIAEPLKSHPKRELRAEHSENFLTSTPRRPFEYQPFKQVRSIKNARFQSNGLIVQSKTFSNHRKSDYQTDHSHITSIPKKFLHLPPRDKSPLVSSDNSPRIQPMKIHSRRRNNEENNSNHLAQNRSPTSWAIICEHQHEQSLDDYITGETFQLTPPDEEELLDGRHVIPDIALFRKFVDCASQTSSRHTQPFICANDFNFPEVHRQETVEHFIDIPSHSSSSLDRLPIPVEKTSIHMDKDDLSTNYDSDDGWSNDSAELIYTDERYLKQKKKYISSSNSIKQQ